MLTWIFLSCIISLQYLYLHWNNEAIIGINNILLIWFQLHSHPTFSYQNILHIFLIWRISYKFFQLTESTMSCTRCTPRNGGWGRGVEGRGFLVWPCFPIFQLRGCWTCSECICNTITHDHNGLSEEEQGLFLVTLQNMNFS